MSRTSFRQIYLFFLIALMLSACTGRKEADIKNIPLDFKIERFDKDFSKLDPGNFQDQTLHLRGKYNPFYSDFIEGMLSLGSSTDTAYFKNLRTVLNSPDYKALNAEVENTYPSMTETEHELEDAFKHVKYYFPTQQLPRVISFISGFAVQTPIGSNYIGIGLDMFLGADSKFYPALRQSIPLYISKRFTRENIAPRVMETYIREELFPEPENMNTLLDRMIYNGKVLYCMDALMPDVADSLKISYTKAQLDWCKQYESGVWGYFLENNLLYETDFMKIQKYLNDAPFTPGIGEKNDSAPKLGVYVGWQIVIKYMEKNADINLQDLMRDNDSQKILSKSKYKP